MQDLEQQKSFHTAAALLPERLWRAAYALPAEQRSLCEELRVRLGRPLAATVAGETVFLGTEPILPTRGELEDILARATQSSVHTYLDQLREGYLTTKDGHRLGLCAQVSESAPGALRGLSSINIRLARQIGGLGDELPLTEGGRFENTLILAPPGAGKTTLLRELCRRLSRSFRVSIADERYEIAACMEGEPRFRVGSCDVVSGGKKSAVLPQLIRAMSPQILALDEITQAGDCRTILSCRGCGCALLAAAHGEGPDDLRRRPEYRPLWENGVFRRVILIGGTGRERTYRLVRLEAGA